MYSCCIKDSIVSQEFSILSGKEVNEQTTSLFISHFGFKKDER
ncbi:hypothetical protein SynRS9902_01187 [Synechococcus sp. RS9902]|nr:hypothetical protein SynRS9902_01187 [Synechococcus sp. RS9902]